MKKVVLMLMLVIGVVSFGDINKVPDNVNEDMVTEFRRYIDIDDYNPPVDIHDYSKFHTGIAEDDDCIYIFVDIDKPKQGSIYKTWTYNKNGYNRICVQILKNNRKN